MRNLTLIIALTGLTLPTTHSLAETTLARVNGKVITLEEFNQSYQNSLKYLQVQAPDKETYLGELIKRELGIQEAKRIGLEKDAVVKERLDTVLYNALIEKKLTKKIEKISVSDSDAKRFLKKNPEIRTSHILVTVSPKATKKEEKEALKKIKEIYSKHIRPKKMSFSEVAQRYSEGISAPMGGDIDFRAREDLDPAYYAAAIKLRVGGLSQVVRSKFGYHIIKLTEKRSWSNVNHGKVKQRVFQEKRKQLFENYMNSLRRKSKVTINAKLIK